VTAQVLITLLIVSGMLLVWLYFITLFPAEWRVQQA
jgi:hypothetical protein